MRAGSIERQIGAARFPLAAVRWLRDAPWLTETRLSVYPKLFLAVYAVTYVLWLLKLRLILTVEGTPVGVDFVTFWAASHLALSGHPADVYRIAAIHKVEQAAAHMQDVRVFGWYYPPPFLLYVLPLALLPYSLALVAWLITTLAAYVACVRKIAPARQTVWLALAFPGTWINFLNGQNGFLSATLLGGGLLYLESQPIIAGLMLGGLIFKPQLALLLPIALIFGGHWRCMISAAASATAFGLIAWAAFGSDTWLAFLHSLPVSRVIVLEKGMIPYFEQQSVFAAMRLLGASVSLSYAIQGLAALAAAGTVAWLWTGASDLRLKSAALVLGGLLVTPYLFDYDLTLLGLAIAWLGIFGVSQEFVPHEKSLLVFAWLSPILDRVLAKYMLIPIAPFVDIGLLYLILVRALRIVRVDGNAIRPRNAY